MMLVLGVDLGITRKSPTAIALVEFAANTITLHFSAMHNVPPSLQWFDRVALAGEWVMEQARERNPDLLAYEEPHLRKFEDAGGELVENVQTLRKLAAIEGTILLAGQLLRCQVVPVQPVQAKQALTGSHLATKRMMQDAAKTLFGKSLPEHCADAAGIAMAGEAMWRYIRVEAAKQ